MKVVAVLASLLIATAAPAQVPEGAVAAADAFDQAIARGDEARIRQLLAPDVLIYEMGGQEASLDEYAAHHLKADIAFMRAMKREVLARQQGGAGELAWVATRRRVTGTFKDKPVDLFSTETLVLRKDPAGWRIVHVQWSSQSAAPKK